MTEVEQPQGGDTARPDTARPDEERDARVQAITRPEKNLLWYYLLGSLATGPFALIAIIPLYFRYHTLRYAFDDDGISVSWGILFRRENHLTYRRIQDIHVTRNFLERWLGIATVSVQTASGSGEAEAQIAGVRDFEDIRNFLYTRMRGLQEVPAPADEASSGEDDEAVALLREIRDTLTLLADRGGGGDAGPGGAS